MKHVYSKRFAGKVNELGYIVDGVPFLKLFDAETYCMRHELDVNEAIELNPKKAKDLARLMMPEYKYMISVFEEMRDDTHKHLNQMCICRDKALEQRGIAAISDSEVYQERIVNDVGKHSAIIEALKYLRNRSWELYCISRLTITEGGVTLWQTNTNG